MTAVKSTIEARFEAMTPDNIDLVVAVEQLAYAHPWVRANFTDALTSGYQAQLLMGGDTLAGLLCGHEGGG